MLSFVGVGPGDPELLTIKAARILRAADLICLAQTGRGESAVRKILGPLLAGKEILPLHMPMTGGREDWRGDHLIAAEQLALRLQAGARIAYPVLGDPSLYASSGYLLSLLKDRFECEVVPGVSAPCAAAAAMGVALAEGRQRLTILPGLRPDEGLPEGNVVVMKATGDLRDLSRAAAGRPAFLARNLGMSGEYCGPLADAPADQGYFSTVLVGPRGGSV